MLLYVYAELVGSLTLEQFDVLGAFAVLVATLFALTTRVTAGWAGVCINYAMNFTTSVYWACRFWTSLELDLKYAL